MGCGQSVVNKYDKQNKMGIFPPEQVREVLDHVWTDKMGPEAPTATGRVADEVVAETIVLLGQMAGQERSLDVAQYNKDKAQYIKGGMFGKTYTINFEQAQQIIMEQMAL